MKTLLILPALVAAFTLQGGDLSWGEYRVEENKIRDTLEKNGKIAQAAAAYRALGARADIPGWMRFQAWRAAGNVWIKAKNEPEFIALCHALSRQGPAAGDTMAALLGAASRNFPAATLALYRQYGRKNMTETQRSPLIVNLARLAYQSGRYDDFKTLTDELTALTPSEARLNGATALCTDFLRYRDFGAGEGILQKMCISGASRPELEVLNNCALFLFYSWSGAPADKRDFYAGRMAEIVERGTVAPPLPGLLRRALTTDAKLAFEERGDFAGAEKRYRMLCGKDADGVLIELAVCALYRGADTEAVDMLTRAGQKATTPDLRYTATLMHAFLTKKTVGDAEKTPGIGEISAERRYRMLCQASSRFYLARRYDLMREISGVLDTMLRQPVKKIFHCRYLASAPRSADSWARAANLLAGSDYTWRGFEPYGIQINCSFGDDMKRLKSAPVRTVRKEYLSSLSFAYDELGLHIYCDAPDPERDKIARGVMDGGSLECLFQAGDGAPYRQWFFEALPGNKDHYEPEWDAPGRHYMLSGDHLLRDTALTVRGTGAYMFIPWFMEYNRLPMAGREWKFGLQRWCGEPQTTGGRVHELSRVLYLKFDFSPVMLNRIQRAIADRAAADYGRLRGDKNSFLAQWDDDETGDRIFFRNALREKLAELDRACGELAKLPPDGDVREIFEKFVPRWINIKEDTDALRVDFLKKQMFE